MTTISAHLWEPIPGPAQGFITAPCTSQAVARCPICGYTMCDLGSDCPECIQAIQAVCVPLNPDPPEMQVRVKPPRTGQVQYPSNPFKHPAVFWICAGGMGLVTAGYFLSGLFHYEVAGWVKYVVTTGWGYIALWKILGELSKR